MPRNPVMEYVLSLIVYWLNIEKGDVVLDIGCGHGFFSERIAALVPKTEVIGCDVLLPDKQLVKKVNLVICDAQILPFKNESINKIIMNEVLEHLANGELAVSEIARVLVAKGRAYVATPNSYENMFKPFVPLAMRGDWYDGHIKHFSARELEAMCRRRGLTIVHYHYEGFFALFLCGSFIYFILKPIAQRANRAKVKRITESRLAHRLSFRFFASFGKVLLVFAQRFDSVFKNWNKGMGIHLVVTKHA